MYVCMYVYILKCMYMWRSNRVLVRLGLDTLIGIIVCIIACMYVCMYVYIL